MQPDPSRPDRPEPPDDSRLGRELRSLIQLKVLSAEQAARLSRAAQQDRADAAPGLSAEVSGSRSDAPESRSEAPRACGTAEPSSKGTPRTGVLDVLGYLGGALVLGALIFVGFTLWGDLTRTGKTVLALASLLLPAVGGGVLIGSRARRGLALVLLALACFAAGFACSVLIDDQDLIISTAVIMLAAAIGAVVVRSAAFYLPAWVGSMGFVPFLLQNGLGVPEGDPLAYALAGGYLLMGVALLGAGVVLGRPVAWTLAGLSGWAATVPLVVFEHSYLALVVATIVAVALLAGVVRQQRYAFAVVGCLIVLSVWPVALYQILDTALGVGLGLVAAGGALISAAVLIARRRHRESVETSPPGGE